MQEDFTEMEELLNTFRNSPAFCKIDTLIKIEYFLNECIKIRDLCIKSFGYEPTGLTLESYLGKVKWYKDFQNKEKEK